MEIGKKIRELRMRKGLTQEELANRSELSKGFISQLENDVTSPSARCTAARFRLWRKSAGMPAAWRFWKMS